MAKKSTAKLKKREIINRVNFILEVLSGQPSYIEPHTNYTIITHKETQNLAGLMPRVIEEVAGDRVRRYGGVFLLKEAQIDVLNKVYALFIECHILGDGAEIFEKIAICVSEDLDLKAYFGEEK